MLKSKRSVSACSLISCRIRAESLARAFNSRIWPCVWTSQQSSVEREDGMSNGIDDEEEFFDASPSPVEPGEGEESELCQQHSSAATEAGRAKLYELLQQHAVDDAIDVFYDAGEDAGTEDTCLSREDDAADQVCGSSECCKHLEDESYFSNTSDSNGRDDEPLFLSSDQAADSADESTPGCREPELSSGDKYQQTISDVTACCCLDAEKSSDENSFSQAKIDNESVSVIQDALLNETKNDFLSKNCLACVDNVLKEERSQEPELSGDKHQQTISDVSACCCLDAEKSCDENSSSQAKIDNESVSVIQDALLNETRNDFLSKNCSACVDNVLKEDSSVSVDTISKEDSLASVDEIAKENSLECSDNVLKENYFTFADKVSNEIQESQATSENRETSDLPSSSSNRSATREDDSSFKDARNHHVVLESASEVEAPENAEKNKTAPQISIEVESPSTSSDSSEAKTPSPTSRFQEFEESRPKLLKSTSLKTGKTPPGTPSRKKIVRFADVLGLDLEDVRLMTGDLPTIPSSAYTDLNLKDVDLSPCEIISETLEINRRDTPSWQPVRGATANSVLYPQFSIPGEQPDFMDRVRHQGICLETVLVSEMNVQCTCRVMNYGYLKRVVVRYTVNDWLSSNDIDATYVSGSSDNETDSFSFSIFLSPLNKDVKFALKYVVNGQEYWDNNRNQNYCLTYHGNDQMDPLPSPFWQHQFW